MPTKRCCCRTIPCLLLTDNFNRADSSDLGSDWEIISGSPEITSNVCEMTAGEMIATVVRNPGSRRGSFILPLKTTGSGPWEVEIWMNYGDGVNHQVASVEWSSTEMTMTVGGQTRTIDNVDVGQPPELIWGLSSVDYYVLQVSMTNRLFYVSFSGDEGGASVWDHEFVMPTAGGGRVAIKVISGTVQLCPNVGGETALEFYRHFDDDQTCPDYACECTPAGTPAGDRRWKPWRTRIDFYSDDGAGLGCDVFNGGYLIFEIAEDGGTEPGGNTWRCVEGEIDFVSYGYGTGNEVEYYCGTPTSFLAINFNPVDCTISDGLSALAVDSCDPFSITFETVETTDITTPCNPCVDSLGSFYAIMTDATP